MLTVNGIPFRIPAGPRLGYTLHLCLDASVAELIVDIRHAITTRIYRPPNGPLRIKISDQAQLKSLEAWQLWPISKDRLTTRSASQPLSSLISLSRQEKNSKHF